MPSIGETAPDFELLDDEGKKVKLSDFRGQKVVLYFYPADFTSGCELQACKFRDGYPQIEEANAIVLGVSPDTVDSHRRFREAHGLPFHLLVDRDKAVATDWEAVSPTPTITAIPCTASSAASTLSTSRARSPVCRCPLKRPRACPWLCKTWGSQDSPSRANLNSSSRGNRAKQPTCMHGLAVLHVCGVPLKPGFIRPGDCVSTPATRSGSRLRRRLLRTVRQR